MCRKKLKLHIKYYYIEHISFNNFMDVYDCDFQDNELKYTYISIKINSNNNLN